MSEIKARYRNKLKKVIIEVWNGEKWLYVRTLSDPLIEFNTECLAKVSQNKANNEQKQPETFVQDLLNAPKKKDTKPFADRLFDDLGLNSPPKKEVRDDDIKELEDL